MSRIADWPSLFGHIITATGWRLGEVEALSLAQANELMEYWHEHPPTHLLLGALLQAKTKKRSSRDLAGVLASVGGTVRTKPSQEMQKLIDSL